MMLRFAPAVVAVFAAVSAPAGAFAHEADLPPHANPGECFAKVVSQPVYGTSRRQVLVKSGWTETVRTPALTERVAKKVLVRAGSVQRIRIQPTYRRETTWVERPGPRQIVNEPPRYETVREKVLVEAGHAEWRRQDAPLSYGETNSGQTLLQATGEIMCRVWVPARYSYTSRRVLVSPGRSYEVEGPPRHEQVTRTVQVSAGGWSERHTAAVYRTVYVTRTVRGPSVRTIRHPAVYRTVESERLVSPARSSWVRVVCQPQH